MKKSAGLVFFLPILAFADEVTLPCPAPLKLKEGYYVAVAAGYDVYKMTDRVSYQGETQLYKEDPRLAVNGMIGDFILGYSRFFGKNANWYLNFEVFANGSAADSDFQTSIPSMAAIIDTDVIVNGSYGLGISSGFKINPSSIFYLKLGYNWSTVSLDETFRLSDDYGFPLFSKEYNEEMTIDGMLYGVGLESAFNEQFSIRSEYTYSHYRTFHTEASSKIDASRNQYMFGLVYHFS